MTMVDIVVVCSVLVRLARPVAGRLLDSLVVGVEGGAEEEEGGTAGPSHLIRHGSSDSLF